MNTIDNITVDVGSLENESVISLNETGVNLAKEGNKLKAEEYFLKAIELDPDYPESYHNLGILQAVLYKTNEAIINFKKLIDLEPYNPEHHNNLGIIYFKEGIYNDSESSFRKALEVEKDYTGALFNLGKLLYILENTDESILVLEHFHEIDDSNTEAMDVLGLCYLKNNEKEKARLIWEKALEINPGMDVLRNRLEEIS